MSDLLTVDELIQRIKEQNGAVIDPTDMDWILVTRRLHRRAVFASDIPKIMDSLLDTRMITNTDMKPIEPAAVECEGQDNVVKENLITSVDMINKTGSDVAALREMDAAVEMRRLTKWSEDLAAWVVESSTDESGQINRHEIDAALGGETWVPGWMVHNGKRMTLASTVYRVEDV